MGHFISKDRFESSRRSSKRVAATIVAMAKDIETAVIYKPQRPGRATFSDTYELLPQVALGRSIAGQVQQCIHRPTGQPRAVKIVSKSRVRCKDRIRREIDFLRQARHPNIIKLHDAYEDRDEVLIVTEMCRGGDLFDRIVEKASQSTSIDDGRETTTAPACFREVDAARIAHHLLSAVAYLHSKDIVHRDIKPENILFVDEDDIDRSPVKLIDFGLSVRHAADRSPLTDAVGTSYYMAPELVEGSYDRSCDLWSVGVVAYLMLAGRPPFDGPTDDVIFKKIRRGLPDGNLARLGEGDDGVSVSASAKDFVRRLLDVDPRRRWSADMALGHEWLQLARVEALFLGPD